jgi:tripartite-type tricarboxylate transporter receptor subunit TctC
MCTYDGKPSGPAVLIVAAFALAAAMLPSSAQADWPSRPVTVVVPTAAGGNTDMMARLAADHLTSKLGQSFVVDNRPSAGGAVASKTAASAAPDGYTFMFAPNSMVLLTPLVQKIGFDPRKLLTPITNVGTGTQVIAIRRELPVTTLAEFITYAKKNPGKLNYAIAGANNISHLGPVLLFKRAGIELVMVPARGEPQAINDLMAGTVDFYFGNTSQLLQHGASGRVRLLAVGSAERIGAAPDLATISETVPGFVFASWNGFFAPNELPRDIAGKVRGEIASFVKSPEVAKKLTALGIVPGGMGQEEVARVFKIDRQNFSDAVEAAGIQPQ